jgi:hypothetical protein
MTNELFFDTDCLSAFLWINNINILHELYGGKIVLPESVYIELSNPSIPHIKQRADVLINSKDVFVKSIEEGNNIWGQMLAKKRKLPANTFTEYLKDIHRKKKI